MMISEREHSVCTLRGGRIAQRTLVGSKCSALVRRSLTGLTPNTCRGD